MKVLLIVGLFLILGMATGFQRRNRGYSRRNSPSAWFRNEDIDADKIELWCNRWRDTFGSSKGQPTVTRRGVLCIKSQATVKILTWCRKEEFGILPDRPKDPATYQVFLKPTVVDSKASYLGSCDIFYVTFLAEYNVVVDVINNNNVYERNSCFVRLLEGILVCVDEAEVLPEFQILTLYPLIYLPNGNYYHSIVNYIICSTSDGNHCPGPAKIVSVGETDEEFRAFSCFSTANVGPCID